LRIRRLRGGIAIGNDSVARAEELPADADRAIHKGLAGARFGDERFRPRFPITGRLLLLRKSCFCASLRRSKLNDSRLADICYGLACGPLPALLGRATRYVNVVMPL
jgi:hypothetical protein